MTDGEIFLYTPKVSAYPKEKVLMAFPGPESFALSSLGYLWLFKDLDEDEEIFAKRVYSDTAEISTNPKTVDFIAFSMSFDMDFLKVFEMLEKFGIPLKKSERGEDFPLIFAGGPVVTANPTPYEEFFDFFIIGDGEKINTEVIKSKEGRGRTEFLEYISTLDGVYVPNITPKVKKRTQKPEEVIYTPIISEKAFFKNTFIAEVARGCANRCGFCLASYLNLPLRCLDFDKIISTLDLGLKHTKKIALLGAQLSAHPRFGDICKYIHNRVKNGEQIEMSVSSLRVDTITPEILEVFKACGQKNITLAIEAGSERLRKVINKNLTQEQIFKAVEIAKNSGLKGFKFYGMIGIPTETDEDIEELITLARDLKSQYKGFNISFGFSTFVPKPHTPFQWCGRENSKSLEKKSKYLKKELHKIGINADFSGINSDYWQAVLSRGDNTLADFLIDVYKLGGKSGAFKKSAKEHNIDTDYFALQDFDLEKPLPWDFIELNPQKEFLKKEHDRLLNCNKNS